MAEFLVGSVVTLRSGSAAMTVVGRFPPKGDEAIGLCRCMYFADGKFGEVMVPEPALESVGEPSFHGDGGVD